MSTPGRVKKQDPTLHVVQDDVMKHSTKSINLHLLDPNYTHVLIAGAMTYTQFFYIQRTNKIVGESLYIYKY